MALVGLEKLSLNNSWLLLDFHKFFLVYPMILWTFQNSVKRIHGCSETPKNIPTLSAALGTSYNSIRNFMALKNYFWNLQRVFYLKNIPSKILVALKLIWEIERTLLSFLTVIVPKVSFNQCLLNFVGNFFIYDNFRMFLISFDPQRSRTLIGMGES